MFRPFKTPDAPWEDVSKLAQDLVKDEKGPLFGKPENEVADYLDLMLRGERPVTHEWAKAIRRCIQSRLFRYHPVIAGRVDRGVVAELEELAAKHSQGPEAFYADLGRVLVNGGTMREPLIAVFETLGQYDAEVVAQFLRMAANLNAPLSKETCLGLLKDMAGRKE